MLVFGLLLDFQLHVIVSLINESFFDKKKSQTSLNISKEFLFVYNLSERNKTRDSTHKHTVGTSQFAKH